MTERRQQYNDYHGHSQRRSDGGGRGRPVRFYEESYQSAPIPVLLLTNTSELTINLFELITDHLSLGAWRDASALLSRPHG